MDTYFLHNNGIESLSMYSNPSFIDTEQNGMSYICKCMSPYAGHNCEGNQQTDKLQCLSSVILSCQVGRKQIGTISISKESRYDGFKSLALHTSDIFIKRSHFHVFDLQMTAVDIAVPMLNAFWDIAFVKRVSMEMERRAKVSVDVKVNSRYT